MTTPPGGPTPPPPGGLTPPVFQEPQVNLFINVAGQSYGPYNYATCKQYAQAGQLTAQTMVWMEGMPAWAPAGQVPALQALFAPPAAMPGQPTPPPMGGPTPPPMG
jgi:hypothetical protein